MHRDAKELKQKELFKQGTTTMELNNYDKVLKEKGVTELDQL